jgi:hypothetical protein
MMSYFTFYFAALLEVHPALDNNKHIVNPNT